MPVYSNPLSYQGLGLGRRIREERKRLGWTLEALAGRLHTSIAALSDLENEKAVLNLERLADISDALGVSPDAFFPRTKTYHFQICRGSQLPLGNGTSPRVIDPTTGREDAYHHSLRALAGDFIGKHIEPYHIEIRPMADEAMTLINHHHEEFFCVLSGEVECVLETPDGIVRERFTAGDCMYFRSYLPHCLRSVQPEPARALDVVCSALGVVEPAFGARDSHIVYKKASHRGLAAQAGAKIRALRQSHGLSMAEFAGELDLTVRQLAAFEEGRKAVPIDHLVRICARFGNPLEHFVASTLHQKPYYFIQRAGDIPTLPTRTRRSESGLAGEVFKSLASGFGERGMYPYHVTLPDPGSTPVQLHEHHGQEFIYVLKGQVKLMTVLDGENCVETLSPGDSCFIDSTAPHRFVSANFNPYDDDSTADVIDVLWCPLGESYLFLDR
jgi:transcriptional regulator with XRE-family HTH domain